MSVSYSRRRFLGGAVATAAPLSWDGIGLSREGIGNPTPAAPGRVRTFGIASPGTSMDAFCRVGDLGYFVTRSSTPTVLGEFDLAARTVRRYVEVPSGNGAWGIAASRGYVFIGMYSDGTMHRLNPADGTFTTIGRLGSATYVWDLTTAPDGAVYAATYPDGRVWHIEPTSGAVTDLGAPVPGSSYARSIAADETTVVVAVNTPGGHVMAVDRETGAVTDITPELTGTGVGYSPLRMAAGRVFVNGGGYLIDMRPDGTDARYLPRPADQRSTDHIGAHPDGTVYLSVLPAGTVYRYRTGDTELTEVATPLAGDGTRALIQLDESTLFGATWSGSVWYLDLADGAAEVIELTEAGMAVSAQRPQSVACAVDDDGRVSVFVGGSSRLHVHRPDTREVRRIFVSGEPKTMMVLRGKIYAAVYPSTELLEIDPRTEQVTSLGHIRNDQYRPSRIDYDAKTGLLLVGSGPTFDVFTGALTVLDPRTGSYDVYRDLLPDQAIRGVAVEDGIAYVAGDVFGEGGVRGPATNPSLAAFDLATRTIRWRADPLPGQGSIWSIGVVDGVVYGVLSRDYGVWFAFDTATQRVLGKGVLSGHGRVFVHNGNAFATVYGGGNIYHLGPGLEQPRPIVRGLGDLWYGGPDFGPQPDSWLGWGLKDGDLARININPKRPGDP